jgi:hypothetical protein
VVPASHDIVSDLVDHAVEPGFHPDLPQLPAGRRHHTAGDLVVQERGIEVLRPPTRELLGGGEAVEEAAGQAEHAVVPMNCSLVVGISCRVRRMSSHTFSRWVRTSMPIAVLEV